MKFDNIDSFKKGLANDYRRSLGLNASYRFINGKPVRPVAPVETACSSLMIVGAYPTAVFETIGSQRDVPVDNIEKPFAVDTKSGIELSQYYLKPLGIQRESCWITNFVKIFLFKGGHVDKYKRLQSKYLPAALQPSYNEIAASLENRAWFEKEIELANPKVVVTLGAAVAGILGRKFPKSGWNDLLRNCIGEIEVNGRLFKAIHFAHPGIIMCRQQRNNPWPRIHEEKALPAARKLIASL